MKERLEKKYEQAKREYAEQEDAINEMVSPENIKHLDMDKMRKMQIGASVALGKMLAYYDVLLMMSGGTE